MRRIFWLAVGLGAGVTVAFVATRWARQKTQQFAPANLGRQAAETGRDDVTRKEREARAQLAEAN